MTSCPDATHFPQLEVPGECAPMVRDCLDILETVRWHGRAIEARRGLGPEDCRRMNTQGEYDCVVIIEARRGLGPED